VRGDSLWSIGKKYGVSIDAIKQANGMSRDIVVLGTKLKIPAQ
jgi:LysM repeat protein